MIAKIYERSNLLPKNQLFKISQNLFYLRWIFKLIVGFSEIVTSRESFQFENPCQADSMIEQEPSTFTVASTFTSTTTSYVSTTATTSTSSTTISTSKNTTTSSPR